MPLKISVKFDAFYIRTIILIFDIFSKERTEDNALNFWTAPVNKNINHKANL